MRPVIILALVLITFSGCNKQRKLTYALYSVSIISDHNLQPVQGANVMIMCLGKSPYNTNKYITDSSGHVSVISFPGFVAMNIEAAGYEHACVAFTSNPPPVVKLKTIES
jgi:hypothetical protein